MCQQEKSNDMLIRWATEFDKASWIELAKNVAHITTFFIFVSDIYSWGKQLEAGRY